MWCRPVPIFVSGWCASSSPVPYFAVWRDHRKAIVYKTIVSDQPILEPGQLIWCNISQMRLEVRNSGETPQQNEQPDRIDQQALVVSNTGCWPVPFIKQPPSFIKHEGRFY